MPHSFASYITMWCSSSSGRAFIWLVWTEFPYETSSSQAICERWKVIRSMATLCLHSPGKIYSCRSNGWGVVKGQETTRQLVWGSAWPTMAVGITMATMFSEDPVNRNNELSLGRDSPRLMEQLNTQVSLGSHWVAQFSAVPLRAVHFVTRTTPLLVLKVDGLTRTLVTLSLLWAIRRQEFLSSSISFPALHSSHLVNMASTRTSPFLHFINWHSHWSLPNEKSQGRCYLLEGKRKTIGHFEISNWTYKEMKDQSRSTRPYG